MASLAADDMNVSTCQRCGQTVLLDELDEHHDWHFAQDLQAQESGGASSTAPTVATQPRGLDAKFNGGTTSDSSQPNGVHGLATNNSFPDSASMKNGNGTVKHTLDQPNKGGASDNPPSYAPPSYPRNRTGAHALYKNQVDRAAEVRARDEVRRLPLLFCTHGLTPQQQQMQNMLQQVQVQYRIYNSEIEPEHEADYPCNCAIHQYRRMKWARLGVQDMWSDAVKYPGIQQSSSAEMIPC